jgi:pimeloyl-ACP methyl ester carboxylesterase
MSYLNVSGARLHYDVTGRGPVLLMILGASGSADAFTQVSRHLAAEYTVVTYDRRAFSRRKLDGAQDYMPRLDIDADDVRWLIDHVGNAPVTVFGANSGAIVALSLLIRYPSVIRVLVRFEPPAMKLLADGQKWLDFFVDATVSSAVQVLSWP